MFEKWYKQWENSIIVFNSNEHALMNQLSLVAVTGPSIGTSLINS